MTLWIDRFVPDGKPIDDVRGALCVTHGERLTAPVGWSFEDRREKAPRLFKPSAENRPNLSVVPDKAPKTRRERAKDLPRPSLFSETTEAPKPVVAAPVSTSAPEPSPEHAAVPDGKPEQRVVTPIFKESQRVDRDDERGADETGDITGSWVPHFDPDDDLGGALDATGPMLRDAFRARHNGRARD